MNSFAILRITRRSLRAFALGYYDDLITDVSCILLRGSVQREQFHRDYMAMFVIGGQNKVPQQAGWEDSRIR
jgi:hypothetical protein